MLTLLVVAPAVIGLVLLLCPVPVRAARVTFVYAALFEVALTVLAWVGYAPRPGISGDFGYEASVPWIPSVGISYHVGVDGLSLPMVSITTVLFLACAVYALGDDDRPRSLAGVMLLLEASCLGLFVSLDLVLFFLFFDLSLVTMYFLIASWGTGKTARASALQFLIYTFVGSLALLLGIIGLGVLSEPRTFDIAALAQNPPLRDHPVAGGLVLLALSLGLAIKTPVVPFHTWLPPAHTDAPAIGSAVLAGVLLKMGTYGFVRIVLPLLPDTWRTYAGVAVVLGVVSVLYGALAALAQTDLKRMIAYTSVNHMGYVLLAIGAAGLSPLDDAQAKALAVTGAVTQMVSHALITGALFLLAGMLHRRTGTYDLDAFGGLAKPAPLMAGAFGVAAFASLGLPGLSGFVAEFQVFAGSLSSAPFAVGIALLGILLTAALFLIALQRVFLGPTAEHWTGLRDLRFSESMAVLPLLGLSLVIGVAPRFLLDVIEPSSTALLVLLGAAG